MDENKNTKRSRGKRLKEGVVETEIITHILKNDVVREPDMIKHLQNEPSINIVDEKNIRTHLRNLRDQHCIEKIQHKSGLENKWKIEKRETLRNILKHYPDIKLKKYDKSFDIISKGQSNKGYALWDYFIKSEDVRIQLYVSDSYFNACLSKDIETLYNEAYEYYKYGEGFYDCKQIQDCIDKFYKECIKLISISPKIWLDVCTINTNNFSELERYENVVKSLPNVKISEETFREVLEDDHIWRFGSEEWEPRFIERFSIKLADKVYQKMQNKIPAESKKEWEKELKEKSSSILSEMLEEIPVAIRTPIEDPVYAEAFAFLLITELGITKEKFGEPDLIFCRELSAKITYEIFEGILKEIPIELLNTKEVFKTLIEILKKILQEVLKKIEALSDKMYGVLTEIMVQRIKFESSIHNIMFKHYFDRDIEDGTISASEREYMVMRINLEDALANGRKSKKDVESDLDQFFKGFKIHEKSGNS